MSHPSELQPRAAALEASPALAQDWPPDATAWPVIALGLMIFLVPTLGMPNKMMAQDTLKSALVAFGVLATALLYFWQQRQRCAPLLWHGLLTLPLTLMLYALASMAWSHTYLAAVEAIRWFLLSLLLWLGLNVLQRREHVTILAWGIHGGALVASLWTALQFWLDFGLFPQGAPPASTFFNRNFFAEYAVCALPFSVYTLANLRASRWLGLAALSVALIVVALMMTGTRSALLALLALGPVFVLILIRYRQQFAFVRWNRFNQTLVGLVLVLGVAGLSSLPCGNAQLANTGCSALQHSLLRAGSLTGKKEYTEGSSAVRLLMWKATARMLMAQPWTGVGAGAWEVQIPLYQNNETWNEPDFHAHNDILQLLSEYGLLVGGLFLAVLWAYLLLAAGKTWQFQDKDRPEAPLRAFTLSSLLALFIVSNAGFPWHMASTSALLALCLAILAASDARLGIRDAFFAAPLHWRPEFSRAMLAGFLCCTVLAGYITQQAAEAERKLVQALQLGDEMVKSHLAGKELPVERTAQWLQAIRDGISINPHYRRLTGRLPDYLVRLGDWTNAAWIWETMAASRPHISKLWFNLAVSYRKLGQNTQALEALRHARRLQPDDQELRTLEVILLVENGRETEALQLLRTYYAQEHYDYALLQAGYALGLKTHDWPLAIRSLELRNQNWPEHAAKGYLLLGQLYTQAELHDDDRALAAFRAALRAAASEEYDSLLSQVPRRYRARL